jgi:hypothetical protein
VVRVNAALSVEEIITAGSCPLDLALTTF